MPNTDDYQILSAPTAEELTPLVQAALKAGWQVWGGLIYVNHTVPQHRKDNFYQAMVKTPNLMEQMLAQLQTIKSNTGTTASNTTAIKNSTASIDAETPNPGA